MRKEFNAFRGLALACALGLVLWALLLFRC